jgi:hypothetical protein
MFPLPCSGRVGFKSRFWELFGGLPQSLRATSEFVSYCRSCLLPSTSRYYSPAFLQFEQLNSLLNKIRRNKRRLWNFIFETHLKIFQLKFIEFNEIYYILGQTFSVCRISNVGISQSTGCYGLRAWRPGLDSRQWQQTFLHTVQSGSGAHQASYQMALSQG